MSLLLRSVPPPPQAPTPVQLSLCGLRPDTQTRATLMAKAGVEKWEACSPAPGGGWGVEILVGSNEPFFFGHPNLLVCFPCAIEDSVAKI